MKKLVSLTLTVLLFSCSTAKVSTEKRPLYEILTQQDNGGAAIRFFEILSEPNEIKMLQGDENLKNKIGPNSIQTANFVVLNMGQKNTGGYKIEVESVTETDKNIIISVKEIEPSPGAMVTESLTTPYSVVRINSKKEIIFK